MSSSFSFARSADSPRYCIPSMILDIAKDMTRPENVLNANFNALTPTAATLDEVAVVSIAA